MSDSIAQETVFAGETESKRICVAELHTDEKGEKFIVTKVFRPLEENFHKDFPEKSGIYPGGNWEILPTEEGKGDPNGVLFQVHGYSLQYALWLIAALTQGINAAGGWKQLEGKVKALFASEEKAEGEWFPLEEVMGLTEKKKEA